MDAASEKFVPGMRAHGQCGKHPGQPFYSCPLCAKERQQETGDKILQELADGKSVTPGNVLAVSASPVWISHRAVEHLQIEARNFRRNCLQGQIQTLRERLTFLTGPEAEPTRAALNALLESTGSDASESFQVAIRIFLDVTGTSGVHPKMELCEPAKIPDFEKDYVQVSHSGLLVAVERQHLNYLRGLIIEWHDRLDASGFVISHSHGEWTPADR